MSKAFQEKYQDSYRVVKLLGKNQLEVKDQNNHVRQVHIMDVKRTTMPEVLVKNIPDYKQTIQTILRIWDGKSPCRYRHNPCYPTQR